MDYSSALASAINEVEADSASECEELSVDAPIVTSGVRNEAALNYCLNQIKLPDDYPWAETLVITHNQSVSVNPDDDLDREVKFYEFTLNSVKQALNRLDQAGIPYQRPADYFAEMVKSDDHMARIKRKLLHEAAAIEKVAEHKRVKELKAHAKQAAAEKKLQRSHAKKANVKAIEEWKKDSGSNHLTAESFDAAMAKAEKLVRKQKKNVPTKTISKARQRKNEKFGSGKPRTGKRNDLTKDDSGPSTGKRRTVKKGKRPGKASRVRNMSRKNSSKAK